ncbi:MAG TPA: hemerythrin domain-containing protein [Polyangiaceae bacterium]|nr:hemerythrin domain-containing protein [Polyangiaceae bacterium]
MDVKRELHLDHEDHVALLKQLTRAVELKRDRTHLQRCWEAFQENLLDHIDTEERYLFTATAQAHRLEIEQLRTEHRRIRQAVDALGVLIELDAVDKRSIDELRSLLQEHSAHEERSLHLWLEMDEGVMGHRGVLAIRTRRERSSALKRVAANEGD